MRKAIKIELYDASAVLTAELDSKFEFTGFDYSYSFEKTSLTYRGQDLLTKMGLLSKEASAELESYLDFPILEKNLFRTVHCSELMAEEFDNSLRISATAVRSHDAEWSKSTEEWGIEMVYRGSYSVFWEV